jgi:hypothetical protein
MTNRTPTHSIDRPGQPRYKSLGEKMKKTILAPLCSALIIPGLGQIVNQEIKKGGFILGAVFLLFVAGSTKLVFILKSMVGHPGSDPVVSSRILEHFDLFMIIGAFFIVWIYSVLDAYLKARDQGQ